MPNLLPMQENGKLPDADASDAMSVRVQFDAQNATGFSYDADSKTYRMLHADGTPQLDANNGQQADSTTCSFCSVHPPCVTMV